MKYTSYIFNTVVTHKLAFHRHALTSRLSVVRGYFDCWVHHISIFRWSGDDRAQLAYKI